MSCLTLPFFRIFHRLQDWPLTPGLESEISPLTTDPGTSEASRPKTQPETPGMFSASRYHCSWGVLKSLSWILKFWRLNRTWMLFWTMRCNGRHYVDICCPCFRVPNLPFVGNILLHMGTFGTANHMPHRLLLPLGPSRKPWAAPSTAAIRQPQRRSGRQPLRTTTFRHGN